ncbi:AAA family ATPase [Microvirga massiliensis]|uniref:AAA family ATPase n=1 Tax=Microvirga massiliensis TaxID=1033741 RepID=UPI00066034FC|nr:AAA family ATPase [Microvirga massiliensis]
MPRKRTQSLRSSKTSAPHQDSGKGSDLLARAFLDILAREEGARTKPMLRSGKDPDDPIEQLLDDLSDPSSPEAAASLRPNLAAVAVLTARAIEAEPGLTKKLRREAPVVVLATHTPDVVATTKMVVETCALPADTDVYGTDLRDRHLPNAAFLLARDGTGKDDKPDTHNDLVALALHRRLPIIGIAPDPRRHLPRDMMRTAEYRLSLPQLDESGLRLVIEAVTGQTPTRPIDPDILRILDVADLPLALRADRTPDDCVALLEATVSKKTDYLGEGPSLEDLDGYGEAKTWGLELAADLADLKAGRIEWSAVDHKGLLLSGPPGVGKTQYARALAKTARVPLVATSVADWNAAQYLSGTLQAIRNAFAQARRLAPCILFIDELDGISDRARLQGDYVEYWTQIVNLLLELLAGVDERPGVVVLAATNFPEKIDAAVKRAGRLDREIAIGKPDIPTLARIFRHHVGADLEGVDLLPLALAARGATGADVEAVVRRAKGGARRARRPLRLDDLMAEIRANQKPMTPEVRRRIAIHEAGHVVVSRILGIGSLIGVSLHDSGGFTDIEGGLDGAATLPVLERMMTLLLAGRVAERLVLGNVSIGAGLIPDSDLGRATDIARSIELRYGLGLIGNVYIDEGVPDALMRIPGLIAAVKARLDDAFERATAILSEHRAELERVAVALEKAGYLSGEEVEALVQLPGDFQLSSSPNGVETAPERSIGESA